MSLRKKKEQPKRKTLSLERVESNFLTKLTFIYYNSHFGTKDLLGFGRQVFYEKAKA